MTNSDSQIKDFPGRWSRGVAPPGARQRPLRSSHRPNATRRRTTAALAILAVIPQATQVVTVKPIIDVLKVGRRGEIVLPRRVRAALALQEGDELVATVEEDHLVLRRKARRFHEYLDNLSAKSEEVRVKR